MSDSKRSPKNKLTIDVDAERIQPKNKSAKVYVKAKPKIAVEPEPAMETPNSQARIFLFSESRIDYSLRSALPASPISITSEIVNPSTVEHGRTRRYLEALQEKKELQKQQRINRAISLCAPEIKINEVKIDREPAEVRAEKLFMECKAKHGALLKKLINPELDDYFGYIRIIRAMNDMLDQKEDFNLRMTAMVMHALSVKEFRQAVRENPRPFAIMIGQLTNANPFNLFSGLIKPPLMMLLMEDDKPAEIKRENIEAIVRAICSPNFTMDIDLSPPPVNLFCQIIACADFDSPAIRTLENEILAKLENETISKDRFSRFMKQWDDLHLETKGAIAGPGMFPRMIDIVWNYPGGDDERSFYYLHDLLNRSLEFARRERNILVLIGKSERPVAFAKIIDELEQIRDSISKPTAEELDLLGSQLRSVLPKLEYVAAHRGLHGLRASPCKSDWDEFCRENAVSLKILGSTQELKHEMKKPG